eukprot:scaffold27695_cov31-Tisochrysis_lutea.AAC.2
MSTRGPGRHPEGRHPAVPQAHEAHPNVERAPENQSLECGEEPEASLVLELGWANKDLLHAARARERCSYLVQIVETACVLEGDQ